MQLTAGIHHSLPPLLLRISAQAQMTQFGVCARKRGGENEHHGCLKVAAFLDFLGENPGGLEEAEITPRLYLPA